VALSLTILFSGTAVFTPATYAATAVQVGGKAVVTNTDGDNIRVRANAGKDNKQVAEAHQGEVVTVLAVAKDSNGNTWYKVSAPGGTGWIVSDYLAGKSGAASAPAAAPKAAAPSLTGFGKVSNTNGDNLVVRTDAKRGASVVTKLKPNASVAIKKGPVTDGENITWYQITANGVTGWAMAQYLSQADAPVAETANKVPAPAAPAAAPAAPAAAPAAPAPVAAAPQASTASTARTGTSRGAQPATQVQASSIGATIVSIAMKYQGYRYVFGGMSPRGFDCSGFVCYVVNRAGRGISRDMGAQYSSGTHVSSSNLQPGDLLFFSNTYKRGLSHAGIYIGNGKFIHAENESTGVTVSSVWSAYWAAHYTGATRLR